MDENLSKDELSTDNYLILYHGSKDIIETPFYGGGKKNNDFGYGFYCTQDINLSKEWAVSSISDGFSNKYCLDINNLRVLNLNSKEYTVLNWIAILLNNRVFTLNNPVAKKARNYLIDNFNINVNAYDLIIGYRADDSYFDYALAFINNTITLEQLSNALRLGQLGEQIVIKSPYAFSKIKFICSEKAKKEIYFHLRKNRDSEALKEYGKILDEVADGLFVQDIMRGNIKNDDPRIPKNIS